MERNQALNIHECMFLFQMTRKCRQEFSACCLRARWQIREEIILWKKKKKSRQKITCVEQEEKKKARPKLSQVKHKEEEKVYRNYAFFFFRL